MGEYQYVAFRAVDRPLNNTQLAFAQQQSSRADVSRWELSVEYQYSSFRGDVDGLLCGGYDVYLQYSNYGTREIKLRMPSGLPFTKGTWEQYIDGEQLAWEQDRQGNAGILTLRPFVDAGGRDVAMNLEARGTANYKTSALILAELREAIGGDEGDQVARRQAEELVKKFPTLTQLKGALRKCQLIP